MAFKRHGGGGGFRKGGFDRGGDRPRFGGGDRPRFGGGGGGGFRRDGDRPQMHHAVCAECGNDCEVPFRPTGDRPIYCKNCFGGKGGDDRAPRQDRPSFDRGAAPSSSQGSDKAVRELSQKVDAIAQKLDALIALFDDMTVAEVEGAEGDAMPSEDVAEVSKKGAKKAKKAKK